MERKDNPLDGVVLGQRSTVDANKKAEDIEKVIKEWLSDNHINAKTRLTKNQVTALAILKSIADKYDIRALKKFLHNFQRYKLSEDGQSSQELVDILKDRQPMEHEDNILSSLGRFLEK